MNNIIHFQHFNILFQGRLLWHNAMPALGEWGRRTPSSKSTCTTYWNLSQKIKSKQNKKIATPKNLKTGKSNLKTHTLGIWKLQTSTSYNILPTSDIEVPSKTDELYHVQISWQQIINLQNSKSTHCASQSFKLARVQSTEKSKVTYLKYLTYVKHHYGIQTCSAKPKSWPISSLTSLQIQQFNI